MEFRAKYSPDCIGIRKASGLGCVSVPPNVFLPHFETHYSGSGPVTLLFYLQCTNYNVVCDQIANQLSSFALLNANSLRKYRGKPSLRFASF